jgi:hypothetical protein
MEGVERKLQSLRLSEAEKKGVKISKRGSSSTTSDKVQAVGKVLSDRPARVDAIISNLGRIWCPFKGLECKDMGMNRFLFAFREAAGKKKALFDGPWTINKKLLVMEDFNPSKTLEEYEFKYIPIWVRAYGIPLGLMDKETGELLGDAIGEFLCVDVDDNGQAAGEYLRIKVKIDITKPLMRGTTLYLENDDENKSEDENLVGEEPDGEENGKVISFKYEFLPDFCYVCGIIGHNDRSCSRRLERGEQNQYGPWLRADVMKRSISEEDRTRSGGERGGFWRTNNGGNGSSKQGIDAISWRKKEAEQEGSRSHEWEERQVTSPDSIGAQNVKKLLVEEKEGPPARIDGNTQGVAVSNESSSGLVSTLMQAQGEKDPKIRNDNDKKSWG